MSPSKGGFDWRIGFALFGLIYIACAVYLALDNFDKVHDEYRWSRELSQPEQISKIALQELAEACRKKNRREMRSSERYRNDADSSLDAAPGPCLSWPEAVLLEKQKTVTERLKVNREKLKRKLVVFYISFAFFFLFVPLGLLYLIMAFLVWLFKDLKFMK